MGTVFSGKPITTFQELTSFTGVTSTSSTFRGCSSLVEITIPENVTTIGAYTFYQTSIRKLVLPAKLTAINGNVFQASGNLTTTIIYATNPPTISSQARMWLRGTIYVPDDSVEAYRTANEWSNIASRIVGISEYEE